MDKEMKREVKEYGLNIISAIKNTYSPYSILVGFWNEYKNGEYANNFDKTWQAGYWDHFTWRPTLKKFIDLVEFVISI